MKRFLDRVGQTIGDWIGEAMDAPTAPAWLTALRTQLWRRDGSRMSHDAGLEWTNYVETDRAYQRDPLAFASTPAMMKLRGMFARRTKAGTVNYYTYEHPPVLDRWGQPAIDRSGQPILSPELTVRLRFMDHGPGIAMRDGRDLDPRVIGLALHAAYVKNGRRPLANVYGTPQYRRIAYACALQHGIPIASPEFARFAYEAQAYGQHLAVDAALGPNLS